MTIATPRPAAGLDWLVVDGERIELLLERVTEDGAVVDTEEYAGLDIELEKRDSSDSVTVTYSRRFERLAFEVYE